MPSGGGTSRPAELYPNGRFVNKINGRFVNKKNGVLRHSILGMLCNNEEGEQGAKLRRHNVGTLGCHAHHTLGRARLNTDVRWR